MEFTHGRRANRFYTEEEDEEEEDRDEHNCAEGSDGIRAHPFLPITPSAPSSSSAIAFNWVAASEPSASNQPTSTTAVEKEHMFEKVVTPSDVGKLNRLVIPKQHAEKYFPLDASTHDRGLLLNFEDRNGKPWRFRYSYWNSSQSYVMTKGWSRFVKEKRLDAGDTVSFGRGTGETASHRLFIDWKRRPDPQLNPQNSLRIPRLPYHHSTPSPSSAHPHPYLSFARSTNAPWAAGRLFVPHTTPPPASNYFYFRSTSALADQPNPVSFNRHVPMVLNSIPVAHGKEAAEPKRVRIFGVNLEQPHESADNTETTGLLGLKLRSPLPTQELRLGAIDIAINYHLIPKRSTACLETSKRKAEGHWRSPGLRRAAAVAEFPRGTGVVKTAVSVFLGHISGPKTRKAGRGKRASSNHLERQPFWFRAAGAMEFPKAA